MIENRASADATFLKSPAARSRVAGSRAPGRARCCMPEAAAAAQRCRPTSSSAAPTAGSTCRRPRRSRRSTRTSWRPAPFTTYIFGFRNVTGLDRRPSGRTRRTRRSTPRRCSGSTSTTRRNPNDFQVQLTNLGLALRPDLFDAHTLHWHGFRNVIPFFDGEPTGSVAVPTGRDFTYVYRPRDPGTYMYHCHVEDVEHVHMGMTGLVFVRPLQNGNTALLPERQVRLQRRRRLDRLRPRVRDVPLGGVGRVALGRRAHPAAGVERLPRRLRLLNGRVYPDTLAPNGSIDPFNPVPRRRTAT